MYLPSDSAAGVRFLVSVREGRGLKPSARAAGIGKETGYRWLRETFVALREQGLSVQAELGFVTARIQQWEQQRVDQASTRRHHWAVAGEVEERWWILKPPERDGRGPVEGQAELGYRLLRRYWRKGLASEGGRELIRHGFEDLGLIRVFAETMTVNAASRATMASVGMEYVRTFHMQWDDPIPGAEHGEVEYAIMKDRWLAEQHSSMPRLR